MKKISLTLFWLIVISLLSGNQGSSPVRALQRSAFEFSDLRGAPVDRLVRRFEHYLEAEMQEQQIPGLAIAVVKDSSILLLKGMGVRAAGTTDPVDVHTIFRLASVSKTFAPVLTGLMVEDSLLQWNDRVREYLPNFSLKDSLQTERLAIEHVLSHTTGLPRHAYSNLLNVGVPYPQIRERLKKVDLADSVGTHYNYQNVAYSLIADVLQSVTGKSYADLMRERLFQPLGMLHASMTHEAIVQNENAALPHRRYRGGFRPMEIEDTYYSVGPAAGVNASIADMAQWLTLLLGKRPDIIAPETLEEIFTPRANVSPYELRHWKDQIYKCYYALGWRVLERPNDQSLYHGGYVNGYRSEIAVHPESGLGVVVLSNAPAWLMSQSLPQFFGWYEAYSDSQEGI